MIPKNQLLQIFWHQSFSKYYSFVLHRGQEILIAVFNKSVRPFPLNFYNKEYCSNCHERIKQKDQKCYLFFIFIQNCFSQFVNVKFQFFLSKCFYVGNGNKQDVNNNTEHCNRHVSKYNVSQYISQYNDHVSLSLICL